MGVAMMGTGMGEGKNRAMEAAQKAIASPLLEDSSVTGARGVIINVTGGPDMSLLEVNEALTIIQESAHEDANIIFGAVVDAKLANKVKITVIATGFDHVRTDRSTPANAPLQTPVDMTAYSSLRSPEPSPTIVQRSSISNPPAMTPINAPTITAGLTRRPPIEMPLAQPKAVAVGQNTGDIPLSADPALPGEFDLNLDLDVPAFLRRNEG